ETFALRDRYRPRFRTNGDRDRNSNAIQSGHIAQTGDADLPRLGRYASQRCFRRSRPMGPALERFENRAVEAIGKAGEIRPQHRRLVSLKDEDCVAVTTGSFAVFVGLCPRALGLLAFGASAAARDNHRADGNRYRAAVGAFIAQELLQMRGLGGVAQVQFLERVSILRDVDLLAVDPDRDFTRS